MIKATQVTLYTFKYSRPDCAWTLQNHDAANSRWAICRRWYFSNQSRLLT